MANGSGDEDDAPPAVPQWQPSELARRIAAGHAGSAHFIDISGDELAAMIQATIDMGHAKRQGNRRLYWHPDTGLAVLVNPRDPDGGTALPTDREYFAEWGDVSED